MIPLLIIPCFLASGVLISARVASWWTGKAKAAHLLLPALAVVLVALLVPPTIWATIPILQGTDANIPLAGPAQTGGGLAAQESSVDPALIRYLKENLGHTRVLVATDILDTDPNAETLILDTNQLVMSLYGFSSYPLTINELTSMVANGTLRFFLLRQVQEGRQPSGSNTLSSVKLWVAQHCASVPPSLWQPPSSSSQAGVNGATVLYDCVTLN